MEHLTTVLIADSSEEFCAGLTAALQRADGFQVVGTASDGEQAIRLIGDRKPDVLVLDLMLSKKTRLMILGDWIWQFTYAVFDGEHMFMEEYVEGESQS